MPQLKTFRDYLESHIAESSFEQISSLKTSKFSRLTDSELADLLLQGDRGAASEYWERYSKSVRGLLNRLLGPKKNVETLIQTVFQLAYRECLDSQNQNGLGSTTLRATIQTARAQLKKRRTFSLLPTSNYAKSSKDFDVDLSESSWTLNYLYEIYEKLDGDARLVFMLRYLEQMDLEDIGNHISWSSIKTKKSLEKSRKTVLSRAREIVTPHTGMTPKDRLVENQDDKLKRDAVSLNIIFRLTRKNITGETDSSSHFSGRELFLEAIDLEEISEISNSRSKKTLGLTLALLVIVACLLVGLRLINGHWPLEQPQPYSALVGNNYSPHTSASE